MGFAEGWLLDITAVIQTKVVQNFGDAFTVDNAMHTLHKLKEKLVIKESIHSGY